MSRGAYDFETYDWVNPFYVGLLWGPPDAREWAPFHCLTDRRAPIRYALENMRLLAKFEGVTEWWAHNGGNFDALLLLEVADELGWKVEASPAQGGRIVRCTMRPAKKEAFTLFDSYAVVPSKLSNACKDFHLKAQKLFDGEDYKDDMRKLSREKLDAGCRADCEAVLELCEVLEEHFTRWNGKLKATFSSSALTVAKSAADDAGTPFPLIPSSVNAWCRAGYHGGRVEVFHHSPQETLREYDVTSSYPWSMAQTLPWEYVDRLENPKDLDFEGVVEATVNVPECPVPPLPWKDKAGGLYFPTGEWRGRYTALELRYAMTQGVRVRLHTAQVFKPRKPFASFVETLFALKAKAKGAERQFAKTALNGSYGKLAEKPEKERLYIYPDEQSALDAMLEAKARGLKVRPLLKDSLRFQTRETFSWPKHTNFAAAAYITARSRMLLHGHLLNAGDGLAYTDTDSIHAPAQAALDAAVNEDLGGLKVEMRAIQGEYFAPKLYRLKNLDNGETYLASKGFPVNAKDFQAIVKGEVVFRETFQKVKAQLKTGRNRFTRLEGENAPFRTWGGKSVKRRPLEGGATRPWHVSELEAGLHLEARSPLANFSAPAKKR